MSVSLHVTGFRPSDDQWERMKQAWTACELAKIPVPREVQEFFDWEKPGDKPGMEVKLGDSIQEWQDEYRQGYHIDISKLPAGVRYIRAYLS